MAAPSRESCWLAKSRLSDALQGERRAASGIQATFLCSRQVLDMWGGQTPEWLNDTRDRCGKHADEIFIWGDAGDEGFCRPCFQEFHPEFQGGGN